MLKSIDPLLNADLLYVLRSMGHGDDLVLVDANFPSASVAGNCPLIHLDGVDIPRAGKSILSVLPLDSFVDEPVRRMEVGGRPVDYLPIVQQEFQDIINESQGRNCPMGSIERFAFYEEARKAFAVVATGECRGYGCFLLKKGVILSD